jgi:hypothetical protein
MHSMPWWEPVKVAGRVRIKWLPERSEWVTPAERVLARIACMLEDGHNTRSIARALGVKRRTIERKIAYLLSPQKVPAKNVAKPEKTRALVEGRVQIFPSAPKGIHAEEIYNPQVQA